MCHQTVCLIARYLEKRGIPTLVVATALDIVKFGWPPRSVFMDFPLGHGGGPLFNPDKQLSIAREALEVCESLREPGKIIHLDQAWPGGMYGKRRRTIKALTMSAHRAI